MTFGRSSGIEAFISSVSGGTSSWIVHGGGLLVWSMTSYWAAGYEVNVQSLSVGYRLFNTILTMLWGNLLLCCWSPFLMGVSCWRLINGRLLGGGATLPLLTLCGWRGGTLCPPVVCGVDRGLSCWCQVNAYRFHMNLVGHSHYHCHNPHCGSAVEFLAIVFLWQLSSIVIIWGICVYYVVFWRI